MPTHEIGKSVFETSCVEDLLRCDVWRESISRLFNVDAALEDRDAIRFDAVIKALRVDSMMLTETRSVAQLWQRGPREVAQNGLDHYMVQLFLAGSASWEKRDGGDQTVRAGDIIAFDLACEMQVRTTGFKHLSLIIPRALLAPMLDYPDHHHMQVLPGNVPVVRILADYIISLNRHLPSIEAVEGNQLVPAVAAMVATCLNRCGSPEPVSESSKGCDLADCRIRNFIRQNLSDPEIDVNRICDDCGISRSALYRLFREEGGVRHFLREERLVKAMHDLLFYPDQQISVVARDNGFIHANDFSRAFRRRFGMTPRELRATQSNHQQHRTASHDRVGREYEDWLRQIVIHPDADRTGAKMRI